MQGVFQLLALLWGKVLGGFGKLALLGPLAVLSPALGGIARFVGGIFEAIIEIVVAMSKSPEGRVMLGVFAAGAAFLYLRFHYIEEGKALVRPKIESAAKSCLASNKEPRRSRHGKR